MRAPRVLTTAVMAGSLLLSGGAITVLPAAEADAARCTPGYSPCIRNKASDVDCWGGSGNGPRYTKPYVTYRVTDPTGIGSMRITTGRAASSSTEAVKAIELELPIEHESELWRALGYDVAVMVRQEEPEW